MASHLSYCEKNVKYKQDIRKNFSYLCKEISLANILPHLHETLHLSDYERLHRRLRNDSDWYCNQDLLTCLQKREYWWRAFHCTLVSIDRCDIIKQLGWDDNTFDFGPGHENTAVGQNSGESYNPPENTEKPSRKVQTVEEFTQQKLDVYKKQNNLANQARYENDQQGQRDANQNLLLENLEQKKHSTDFKMVLTDKNDLGKVPESQIHPAVRRNLPLNLMNPDQNEKLSNFIASAKPCSNTEKTPRDEVDANLNSASNSPQSFEKISNSQSFQSLSRPPKKDHSLSAPLICTDLGAAAFLPNDWPEKQTPIQEPIHNVSTSAIHHSLSAPIMNQTPFHERQKHNSANTNQEVLSFKKEDGNDFESSQSAELSTILVRPTSDPCLNFDPSDGRSNAERQEVDLREQNLMLYDSLKNGNRSNPNPESSRSENFEDVVNDGVTSATAIQEIAPQSSACPSNMSSLTTDDVIKPSIASTVDPQGVSRRNIVKDEKTLRHKSPNLNREQDSYVTNLHSYGSDVTSSVQSADGQSSALSEEVLDRDQTNVKNLDSITRVDAFDNCNLDPSSIQSDGSDLDPSSVGYPEAMRLDVAAEVSGSVPSGPSAAGDITTAPPIVEDLHRSNSTLAQNSSSDQSHEDNMPKFDSLLSGSHQSLPRTTNPNLALSDLPQNAQNGNVPELCELLSEGSSVDPADYSENGASPMSVAFPPSSGQLARMEKEDLDQSRDQEDAGNANSASHETALNDGPPSFFQGVLNSIGHLVDGVGEKLFPSLECSE
ncbi:hypothetical protein LOTGIDRAFT_169652 [Lottia gigantea]|uniref:Uncharacterized protein n=1 Tax=Lottia gigantea TaxID=225164 RepID=V3ZKV0_LOTGI|nr:hypothetical protein LOTGIDRAFT_169652 [Lottia gigantea]ESO83025.1 hypothetical protein LOTGIDRAFT_169652 [Lottia gigantea]